MNFITNHMEKYKANNNATIKQVVQEMIDNDKNKLSKKEINE